MAAPSEFKPLPLPLDFFPRRSLRRRLWGWWESLCVLHLGRCPHCLRRLDAIERWVQWRPDDPPDLDLGYECPWHGIVW